MIILRTAKDEKMSPTKGPSQSHISPTEGDKTEVEKIREFKARMADLKNLKPCLTPFLAYTKERWAQFRAEIPMPSAQKWQSPFLNKTIKIEWDKMPEEEKAVYVKKVSAHESKKVTKECPKKSICLDNWP